MLSGLHGAVPVPVPDVNELTIAGFNTERFFDTTDDELLARRQQDMFASVERFIDLGKIEALRTVVPGFQQAAELLVLRPPAFERFKQARVGASVR